MTDPDSTPPAPADRSDPEALREHILELVARYAHLVHAPRPFEPGRSQVPVSGKVFGAEELRVLVDSALDFWLTADRYSRAFEARLAGITGNRHALMVNSGSSANLLALGALTSPLLGDRALRPGDEVITCATGFPTTVNPILQHGLVPVFLDVSLPTYNIDVRELDAAVGPRTRAIMIAHTLGNPFDLDAVMAVARRHELFVVEDCCDALGAVYADRPVGSFGDVATLSFYPAHQITTGEGGAVLTRSPKLKRALESLRDWGRDCWCEPGRDNTCGRRFDWQHGDLPAGYDHKYTYSHLGYNLKATDLQAAIGLAQLDRLDGFVAARRRNADRLREGLADLAEFLILPEATPRSEPSWFGFPITLAPGAPVERPALIRHLEDARIATRLLFGGNLIRQPYMIGREYRVHGGLAMSDLVMNRSFWIGVYPGLGPSHIDHMIGTLRGFVGVR